MSIVAFGARSSVRIEKGLLLRPTQALPLIGGSVCGHRHRKAESEPESIYCTEGASDGIEAREERGVLLLDMTDTTDAKNIYRQPKHV